MLEVVEALEGPIAPMDCFIDGAEGRILCSHESDGDVACSTKLLWTRVHGGITRALAGTTLAELDRVREPRQEAEHRHRHRRRRLSAAADPNATNWSRIG